LQDKIALRTRAPLTNPRESASSGPPAAESPHNSGFLSIRHGQAPRSQ
jgi:hypothetical protein